MDFGRFVKFYSGHTIKMSTFSYCILFGLLINTLFALDCSSQGYKQYLEEYSFKKNYMSDQDYKYNMLLQ